MSSPTPPSTEQLLHRLVEVMVADRTNPKPAIPRVQARTPAAYGGEEFKFPVRRWLRQMNQYFTVTRTAEELRVELAANFLIDAASAWFEVHHAELVLKTWSEFCEAICAHFAPLSSHEAARQKLWHTRQHRTVSEYIRDYMEVVLDIPDISESEKLDRFVHNLLPSVRRHVALKHPRTFAEACREAELFDRTEFSMRNVSAYSPKAANYTRDRRYGRPWASRAAPPTAGPVPMEIGQRQRPPPPRAGGAGGSRIICYYCREPGHMVKDCPKAPSPRDARRPSAPPRPASNRNPRAQA